MKPSLAGRPRQEPTRREASGVEEPVGPLFLLQTPVSSVGSSVLLKLNSDMGPEIPVSGLT